MDVEQFQSWAVGSQISQMDGIAMTKARGIEQFAVVVERCRSPNNLVATITVDIGHRQVMVSVAIERVAPQSCCTFRCRIGARLTEVVGQVIICLRGGGMIPLLFQFLAVKTHCPDVGISVVAT